MSTATTSPKSLRCSRGAGVTDVPKAIVCRTTLGKGVPMIANRERNHFVRVDDDEWDEVARQLEASA